MMQYYRKENICFCPLDGKLPAGAEAVPLPFSPLVFLVSRDPLAARGIFAISQPGELFEPEGLNLLQPPLPGELDPALEAVVRRDGACVLNTAFSRCYAVLERFLRPKREGLRLHAAGLGDVGGTMLAGLTLLGENIAQLGVYDVYQPLMARYEWELNQVLPTRPGRVMPRILPIGQEAWFSCDAFLFTSSKGVPPVGSGVQDVRMAQLAANRELLRPYARQARGFDGLFCQISDPVDQLARYVFLESNRDENGVFDWAGLLPEQVRGFGLGVMEARARFAAERLGTDFTRGTVFGPHGKDLVAANDPGQGYDDALSRRISQAAATANLAVRELGFKPYVAPALSSAAISVLACLSGAVHAAAIPLDGAYFGCHSRMTPLGPKLERQPLHPALLARLEEVHQRLKEFPVDG